MINENISDDNGVTLQCHITKDDRHVINLFTNEQDSPDSFLSITLDKEMAQWLLKELKANINYLANV